MKQLFTFLSTLFFTFFLWACDSTPVETPQEDGFIEREAEVVTFTNAEAYYIGDDIGEGVSDCWLLKFYTDMEIDPAGNPIGPGQVLQLMVNAPYDAQQSAALSLLPGIYTAQPNSTNFAPHTFVDGYLNYIDLPDGRLELAEGTFWGELAEGETTIRYDLVDDGAVEIGGGGDWYATEGIVVGKWCRKHRFEWSGKLNPTSYVEPEVPNSTLTSNIRLDHLHYAQLQDRGDYFALRDQSYRSLLLFLATESVDLSSTRPAGSGEMLRLELLVPWEWNVAEGIPAGSYPMLTRNADTSFDREDIVPYVAIPGLPHQFAYPYWSGSWYVELSEGKWSNNYARIDGGQVTIERAEDGSHHLYLELQDSSSTPYTISADITILSENLTIL